MRADLGHENPYGRSGVPLAEFRRQAPKDRRLASPMPSGPQDEPLLADDRTHLIGAAPERLDIIGPHADRPAIAALVGDQPVLAFHLIELGGGLERIWTIKR